MSAAGSRSLARQRHELIVSRVRREGGARVVDLASELQVSEMTVRRDLDALHNAGLLTKVHGGATVRFGRSADEPGYEVKATRNQSEKRAIAASAAALVTAGAAVGITAGTTTVHLAAELVRVPQLTVVTNSVRVAEVFWEMPRADRTVILLGGIRTPSDALVGPLSVAALRTLRLDTVFMGVHGLHEDAGITTPNLQEADTNRAFLSVTDQVVVLADHTKWAVTGLSAIAPLSDITTCITDDGLVPAAQEVLEGCVGQLVLAQTASWSSESGSVRGAEAAGRRR
jgi:DeoR/GlpR family transcriptional regulator of sugar metabolism